jgi:Zn-finger nucleic acid-binding protein
MKCPKCLAGLVKKSYKGMMEVECCPNCRGMWLDFDELDRLEDVVFDRDDLKGSLIHRQVVSDAFCPLCGAPLQEFQYRLFDLKLEFCPVARHGFWLDAGEDEWVLEVMRRRAAEMSRKLDAEMEWRKTLKQMHNLFKETK